ncbi:MAG: type II secretion system F family protein [Alphaproteobacteria bacterium]|nr:type II secretion system F family protein [Alphaproteobacteria bacterium]
MPLYKYRAVSASGDMLEGEMDAPSSANVAERLAEMGHTPVRAEEAGSAATKKFDLSEFFSLRRGINRRDLGLLTRELSTLLHAGIPLDRALEILATIVEKKHLRDAIERILDQVRGGDTLADAMASRSQDFPHFYTSMVKAGEVSSALDQVLERLADFLERSQAVSESVRSALVYPIILVIVACISLVVLLTGVIPQFQPMFESAGQALPLPMAVLVGVADILGSFWWAFLIVIIGGIALLRRALAQPESRLKFDAAVLRWPLIGGLVRKIEAARFCRMLSTLLHNGVAMLPALGVTRDTLNNLALSEAVDRAAASVKEGRGLSRSFAEEDVLPHLALSMIRVGEETGELERMLDQVADIQERDVQRTVGRLLALLVPALTIGLGLLVAVVIVTLLSAILGVNQLAF